MVQHNGGKHETHDLLTLVSFYDYGTLLEFRHKFPTIFIGRNCFVPVGGQKIHS